MKAEIHFVLFLDADSSGRPIELGIQRNLAVNLTNHYVRVTLKDRLESTDHLKIWVALFYRWSTLRTQDCVWTLAKH
ncbi:hypothetical protein MKX08_002758 [Trichoderma sp. CBMAI-0020]|nr:hypothetical protein MKX08_002758 [Trichoderma sp. CBMAI-0020]